MSNCFTVFSFVESSKKVGRNNAYFVPSANFVYDSQEKSSLEILGEWFITMSANRCSEARSSM